MRPHAGLQLAPLAFAALATAFTGCSSRDASASASPSPDAAAAPAGVSTTPVPLRPCESVELRVDDADVVLSTNPDGTLASVSVIAPTPHLRELALADVRSRYGEARPDTRVLSHQSKWGIPILTDSCGRSVKSAAP